MSHPRVLFVSIMLSATLAFGGWEYSAYTKADGGANSEMFRSSVKGWANGSMSRVELVESGNPLLPAGSYLLSRDGGRTLHIVNPQHKTYSILDLDNMMGLAGGAMEMMGIEFSTPKVEKLLEEKGSEIQGFPTTHYRFRNAYTMDMNFMGMQRSTETVSEEDVWASQDLQDEGLGVWLNQRNMKTGNAEVDKVLQAEMGKVKGFPLKRVATTTTKQQDGSAETVRVTSEVTAIRETDVPASLFELPADYTEKRLLPGGGFPMGAGDGGSGGADNPFLKLMQQRK